MFTKIEWFTTKLRCVRVRARFAAILKKAVLFLFVFLAHRRKYRSAIVACHTTRTQLAHTPPHIRIIL